MREGRATTSVRTRGQKQRPCETTTSLNGDQAPKYTQEQGEIAYLRETFLTSLRVKVRVQSFFLTSWILLLLGSLAALWWFVVQYDSMVVVLQSEGEA